MNGNPASSYEYGYDANGNRVSQIETNGAAAEITTYAYDAADRLIEVAYPDETVITTYDGVGNRLTEVTVPAGGGPPSSDKTWTYDARHRLTQVSDSVDPTATVTYSYDANGNQRSRTQNGVTRDQQWDVRDRLVEISDGASLLMRFLYDYSGLRVRKSDAEGVVRYVYDDRSVLQQTDDAGTTLTKYEYGPTGLLSLHDETEGRQRYAFDALGSVVNLIKPDGSLQARYQWDAWGNPSSLWWSSRDAEFGVAGVRCGAPSADVMRCHHWSARRAAAERMDFLRFYLDPATGEPHIYEHGVTEEEVEDVLRNPGEERPGRGRSRMVIGATEAGRILRVFYAPDPDPHTLFVITA